MLFSRNGLSLYVLTIIPTSHFSIALFCSSSVLIHMFSSSGLKSMNILYFVLIINWKNSFSYVSSFASLQYNISLLRHLIFCSSSAPMNSTILPSYLYVFSDLLLCFSDNRKSYQLLDIISSKSLITVAFNVAEYLRTIDNIQSSKYLSLSILPVTNQTKHICNKENVLLDLVQPLLTDIFLSVFQFLTNTFVALISRLDIYYSLPSKTNSYIHNIIVFPSL